jgi:cytochrome P450
MDNPHVITTWDLAREVYRSKHLRQGLYDGGVVMENVLINLHATEHRDRRRLENPLFRRDVLFRYEQESFPAVLNARLDSAVVGDSLELLSFGHSVMLELASVNAGLDLDIGDSKAIQRLSDQLLLFIDGARILHYAGDKEAKEREVAEALDAFGREFVEPAMARRRALLAKRDTGEITEAEVPRDILRVMLENVESLELDADTILRETAFFLLTGASTSAAALSMTLANIFQWILDHPEDEQRLIEDPAFVQRCVLETLRLAPISPIAARWATQDFTLSDGTEIREGDRLHIDMACANRDPLVFGADADTFDPERVMPDEVPRNGVSFGHGMHHCIGQELAVGIDPDRPAESEHQLFGLVGVVIQALIDLGVRPDPDNPPEIDSLSERGVIKRHPVLLTRR